MAYEDLDPLPAFSTVPSDYLAQLLENTERLHDGTGFAAGALTTAGVRLQEIGRTTLASSGDTLTVSSLPARKYLRVLFIILDTSGTVDMSLRFNSDAGSNYAYRRSANGGADTTGTSTTSILVSSAGADRKLAVLDIINIQGQEKLIIGSIGTRGVAGAANAPGRAELLAKWANTTVQINEINMINGGGTGDYAIGSEVVVLGND